MFLQHFRDALVHGQITCSIFAIPIQLHSQMQFSFQVNCHFFTMFLVKQLHKCSACDLSTHCTPKSSTHSTNIVDLVLCLHSPGLHFAGWHPCGVLLRKRTFSVLSPNLDHAAWIKNSDGSYVVYWDCSTV